MKGMILVGKKKVSDNHRAFSLYQKAIVELKETAEDDHFAHAVKAVANQLHLSQTEAKEAIYKGYAERYDLSYEESKALIKTSRISSIRSEEFENYYRENRVDVDNLQKEYESKNGNQTEERTYAFWLSDRVLEEVEKIREKFDNLDRAIVID